MLRVGPIFVFSLETTLKTQEKGIERADVITDCIDMKKLKYLFPVVSFKLGLPDPADRLDIVVP